MFNKQSFLIIALALFALTKGIFFSFYGLNFFDDGESLHNAARLLEGKVLYRDIWAFFPPLDNYFPALMLKISNFHLLSFRFGQSILYAVFVLTTLYLSHVYLKVNRFYLVLLAVSLVFINVYSNLLFYHLFFFVSVLLILLFLTKKRNLYLFMAGISTGISALFRHDIGIISFISITLTLVAISFLFKLIKKREFIKGLSAFCVGFVMIIFPIIVWLTNQGTISEFLYLAFVKAPQISRILSPGTNLNLIFSLPITLRSLNQIYSLFFYVIFILVYLLSIPKIVYICRLKKVSLTHVLILATFVYGILQIPYAFSVIDMGHLVKAGVPVIVFGFYFIQTSTKAIQNKFLLLILISPILLFIAVNLVVSAWWIKYNDTRVNFKQGSVYVNSVHFSGSTHPTAHTLIKTLDFIEANSEKDDYIFAAPYHAMIYFLSERKSPSRFNNFAAGFVSPWEQDEVIDAIKKKDVKVLVYDPVNSPLKKSFPEYSPKIHSYIMGNFKIVDTTDQGWLLMRRKDVR